MQELQDCDFNYDFNYDLGGLDSNLCKFLTYYFIFKEKLSYKFHSVLLRILLKKQILINSLLSLSNEFFKFNKFQTFGVLPHYKAYTISK